MRRFCVLAVLVGCIDADLVRCDDGTTCPVGTTCVGAALDGCATPDQLAMCTDVADGVGCTLDEAAATCFSGVCLLASCGNARVDVGEACDDGNAVTGDGCSLGCRSDEACGNGVLDAIRLVDGVELQDELCDDGNRLTHDGCTPTCNRENAEWLPVDFGVPAARERAAMAYDSDRRRVVMYGGMLGDTMTTSDEMWEWTGTTWWRPIALSVPPARAGAAMAYDAGAHKLVLFGGDPDGSSIAYGDTWTYDGVEWVLEAPATRPEPRTNARAIYDATHDRVVLYGGHGLGIVGDAFADAWAWSNGNWQLICSPCAPGARHSFAMGYDPRRGVVVVYGGYDNVTIFDDHWELDGSAWTQRTDANDPSPKELMRASLAWDSTKQRLLLVGGTTAIGDTGEVWGFDGQAWTQEAAIEDGLSGHAMAAGADGSVVVFGGTQNVTTFLDFTYVYDFASGFKDVSPKPVDLQGYRAAYDPVRAYSLVVGGTTAVLGDTWYRYQDQQWRVIPDLARTHVQVAFDPSTRRVLLFGGAGFGAPYADTLVFVDSVWAALSPATSPPARSAGAMSTARDHIVLFGGLATTSAFLDDTWIWTGTTWTQHTQSPAPSARADAMIAYDPVRDLVVLFGGRDETQHLGDTWLWSGTGWSRHPGTSPPPRVHGAMEWLPARNRIVLFGGPDMQDTWEFDGSSWTRVVLPRRPSARGRHVFVRDGSALLSIGGELTVSATDSTAWRFRWDSFSRDEACDGYSDLDGDGLQYCADPDCGYRCLACGDAQCSEAESCRLCPADCGACTVVCGDGVCDTGESCAGDCL